MSKNYLGRSLGKKNAKKSNKSYNHPVASVLEESQVEDYVNFCSATDNIILVHNRSENSLGLPSLQTISSIDKSFKNENDEFLSLPRKPSWVSVTGNAAEYQKLEEKEFYRWRAYLASLENSNSHLIMTPFERSLGIWRELWKAVERADILFQVLDARNPLFYYCSDLFTYSHEIRPHTNHWIILNKADLLTEKQRSAWAEYFTLHNIRFVFFSNVDSNEHSAINESMRIYSASDIVSLIVTILNGSIGVASFVGYPNVGKSSTINSLLGISKAAVSATPGKTKHIQTFETDKFTICDCPGLVFPNLAVSKSELILNGVVSIDQMKEYLPSVALLAERVPVPMVEACYNIKVTPEHNVSMAESILSAYARSRGLATSNFGNPDMSKASRSILKDYTAGKLLFCYPPPEMDSEDFNSENPFSKIPCLDISVVHDPFLEEKEEVGFKVLNNRQLHPLANGKKHFKMNKRR